MANSVDPDQTAPIGAVWSESSLFASILKFVSNVRQLFAADDFSRGQFSDAFFLDALRVKKQAQLSRLSVSSYCLFNAILIQHMLGAVHAHKNLSFYQSNVYSN